MRRASRWKPLETLQANTSAGGRCLAVATLVLMTATVAGCQMMSQRTVASPYSSDKQAAEILKIVPAGTNRDEAIRLLEKEGIDGSFGASQSTYYCEVWHRKDGKHWALDVALLFDEEGKLYDTCRAQTDVGIDFVPPEKTAGKALAAATATSQPVGSSGWRDTTGAAARRATTGKEPAAGSGK